MLSIAINGLGRIGKCILRAYFESFDKYKDYFTISVINAGTPSIEDRVHSIIYDSIHGKFCKKINVIDDKLFAIDGHKINMIFERDIERIDWLSLGVDIVLECTGAFNKGYKSHAHIKSGAKKVIVSAPYDAADVSIVLGANDWLLDYNAHNIISIGSCTTNCLAPIAKILHESVGIESGFMTTIHAYTNDQMILDGRHNDKRRARAAALSMIPSSTGAAKSIGLILPELAGKIGGAAVRVPISNVSMIDFSFVSSKNTTKNEINQFIIDYAAELLDIVHVSDQELVSCDFNHTTYSAIFDSTLTHVINENFCRVIAWYDNEWGFSNRMLDVAKILCEKKLSTD